MLFPVACILLLAHLSECGELGDDGPGKQTPEHSKFILRNQNSILAPPVFPPVASKVLIWETCQKREENIGSSKCSV